MHILAILVIAAYMALPTLLGSVANDKTNQPWKRWGGTQFVTGRKTEQSIEQRFKALGALDSVRYAVGQWELTKEGRKHLQIYVEMHQNTRLTGMKAIFYKDTHWKRNTASRDDSRGYAMKTDESHPHKAGTCRIDGTNVIELGIWKPAGGSQGKRTDLIAVKEDIDSGMSEEECWNAHFKAMVMHHKAFDKYRVSVGRKKRGEPTITILHGGSGTGKSAYCNLQEMLCGEEAFWLSAPADGRGKNSRVWWDGYAGEKTVVIDEYYGWLPYSFLLRLLDRNALQVEVKGGSVPLRATNFIFTSNTPPEEWYHLETKPYGGDPFIQRTTDVSQGGRWRVMLQHTGDEPGEFLDAVLESIRILEAKQDEGVES